MTVRHLAVPGYTVPAGVTYDTWTAVGSTYGGTSNEVGTSINVGFAPFTHNNTAQTLQVHGVRYWRTTAAHTLAPTVGLAFFNSSVVDTKLSPVGSGSKPAGWEQVLFNTPYTMNPSFEYIVWVSLSNGGYPATASAFTSGQDSQLGLYTIGTTTNAGKYAYVSTPGQQPNSATTSSFWVEPLVILV